MLPITSHLARRFRLTAIAIASGTAGAVLVWSPGAFAAAGCTTTTPSIGQTIMCNVAGTETITVPDGANAMEVVVIGGGGAGGIKRGTPEADGGDGGQGAFVGATLLLPEGASNVAVNVGAGGSTNLFGGGGGGFSRIEAGASLLVVAGGGGGGGFANPLATGGDGAGGGSAAGSSGGGTARATGGEGGSNGNPGSGGSARDGSTGSPGETYDNGGAGGSGDGGSGGLGGAGYGGGGGGASDTSGGGGGGGAGGSYVNDTYLVGSAQFMPSPGSAGDGGRGQTSGVSRAAGVAGAVSITFFVRSTPTPASSSATAAPATVLVFALPEGVTCSFDSVEASLGSWIELPSASDCTITPRDGGQDQSLLGWATSADFPAEIAERQVDNGWGAYETFNDDGQLTGVFIPAGGYTTVTNDTNLYPIWR